MQKPTVGSRWRNYKSSGGENHTYEIVGIARHSETHEDMVVYHPLYIPEEGNWVAGYDFAVRPLSLWYDIVEYNGQNIQRFREI